MAVTLNRPLPLGLLAAALAVGWSVREAQFARAAGPRVPNTTLNARQITPVVAEDQGQRVGLANVYFDGDTAGTTKFQVGRFVLDPGQTPHAPHRHPEEEILIVTQGTGEIYCDGQKYPVRPGAVMFTDPDVEHGIVNQGKSPLEFYWIKYIPNGK